MTKPRVAVSSSFRTALIASFLMGFAANGLLKAQGVVTADRGISIGDRIAAHRAIERVYYEHRIWPKENPGPKPPYEEMVPAEVIERRARDPLLKSIALKRFWNVEITSAMLQNELDRMVRDTKSPVMLRELFAALANDPAVVAEALARNQLADMLIRDRYARDPIIHEAMRQRARTIFVQAKNGNLRELAEREGLAYSRTLIFPRADEPQFGREEIELVGQQRLSSEDFSEVLGGFAQGTSLFQERSDGFEIQRALTLAMERVEIETVFIRKLSFDLWWNELSVSLFMAAIPSTSIGYKLPKIVLTAGCDQWTPTTTSNAPIARSLHATVWTGSEMIVWGGNNTGDVTGGRYDPATDSWRPTSTAAGVPSARQQHTAVWTGRDMIIWGGTNGFSFFNAGSRYDPASDSWQWTATANAPVGRINHTAVWTGGVMIVWGGGYCTSTCTYFGSGGRYDPAMNIWLSTTLSNAPEARLRHSAIWTGSDMVIWGGFGPCTATCVYFNTGGRYNQNTDGWITTSTVDYLPEARGNHQAVWTGDKMIIWGGFSGTGMPAGNGQSLSSGGKYTVTADSWYAISQGVNTPSARTWHTFIWTGNEAIVWGGYISTPFTFFNTGGRYNSSANIWTATSTGNNVPSARDQHTAIWTGSVMIIWGGEGNSAPKLNTGGVYTSGTVGSPGNSLRGLISSMIYLQWPSITGAGSYNVKRSDLATVFFPYVPTTIVSTPTIPQYSEPDDGQSHFYAVEAVNQCGATP